MYFCKLIKAVSYTHLDVYKRQAVGSTVYSKISGALGKYIIQI